MRDYRLPVLTTHCADRAAEREGHALAAQLEFHRAGHRTVVDDSGGRRVQRGASPAFGLDIGDLASRYPAQSWDAVGMAARLKLRESWQLIIAQGDNQFPAALIRNRFLSTELIHEPGALNAEPGLERAGLVVHATVNHARVVTGLVIRH